MHNYVLFQKITFQTIIASDGEQTYVVYNYKESTFSDTTDSTSGIGLRIGSYVKQAPYSKTPYSLHVENYYGNAGTS